jgi:ketosteroid isomerase-like protein
MTFPGNNAMRHLCLILTLLIASTALGQATQPVTAPDPTTAIGALRQELIDSFNKGDLPRLLSHLDPDVVVTWQNGEVCRGPDAVKAYYDKMMSGPDRIVKTVKADPKVTDRHIYNDWAVSWGEMQDHFVLNDGSEFSLNSRFTATIARRGEAWKVTSFHVSGNLFDNQILSYAVKKTAVWTGIGAGLGGLIIGYAIAWFRRRRTTP